MYYLVVDEDSGEHLVIGGSTYKEAVDMLFNDILDPNETDVYWERDYASKEEAKEDANKNHYEIYDFNYDVTKRKEITKMNVNILYSTNCTITIHFRESSNLTSADWRQQFTNLQDAINAGKDILENNFTYSATGIVIWDSNTGEVLAEILRDEDE